MNIGSCEEGVNARPSRRFYRLPGALDVILTTACQRGNHGPTNLLRHGLHRLKVAVGGNWESRLDNVHSQALELVGETPLFREVHAAPGRLLSIPQRGIEYAYVITV
jgi:hypothetical protein